MDVPRRTRTSCGTYSRTATETARRDARRRRGRYPRLPDGFAAVRREIGKVVVGHDRAIETILTAFFAGGHVLIEGVPGIGKTLIVPRSPRR